MVQISLIYQNVKVSSSCLWLQMMLGESTVQSLEQLMDFPLEQHRLLTLPFWQPVRLSLLCWQKRLRLHLL
jgi:hypothetical protein